MMKTAEIEGYFTNHSARRTGSTRLFQAGVDRKLVKEATGHHSDAVDKYQLTSHEQRRHMSNILAKKPQGSLEVSNNSMTPKAALPSPLVHKVSRCPQK